MAPVTPTTTERGDAVVFDSKLRTVHAASQSILRFARVAPASPLTLALSEELSPENEAIDQARCRTFDGTHRDSRARGRQIEIERSSFCIMTWLTQALNRSEIGAFISRESISRNSSTG